jgi:hypothetical protein
MGRRRDRSVVQDRIGAKRLRTGPVHTATRDATIPVTAALATGATLGDLSAGASTGRQVRPRGRKAAVTTLATCGLPIPGRQVVSAPIVLPVDNPDFRIQDLPMPSREEIIRCREIHRAEDRPGRHSIRIGPRMLSEISPAGSRAMAGVPVGEPQRVELSPPARIVPAAKRWQEAARREVGQEDRRPQTGRSALAADPRQVMEFSG